MAKYKVDKKKFEEKILQEQLKHIELQGKVLKDEPLRRSEIDEYNKLQTSGWIKNTLITLGVAFATAIAFIVFVLLGNMLFTNGRTGNVGKENIDSAALVEQYKYDVQKQKENDMANGIIGLDYDLDRPYVEVIEREDGKEDGKPIIDETTGLPKVKRVYMTVASKYVTYKVPYKDKDGNEILKNPQHDVYVVFRIEWRQNYGQDNKPTDGFWVFGNVDGTVGQFTQSSSVGMHNNLYALDVESTNLNNLMTQWFLGQEDGWAKTLIKDFFYTAWPLTIVLWMVFILVVCGYLVVMVVGVRYVIRTVIGLLRKAGYIASDFVTEVVETVKSEIPVIDQDPVQELNPDDLIEKARDIRAKREAEMKIVEEQVVEAPVPAPKKTVVKKETPKVVEEEEEIRRVDLTNLEEVVVEPVVEEAEEKKTKVKQDIEDIFNM